MKNTVYESIIRWHDLKRINTYIQKKIKDVTGELVVTQEEFDQIREDYCIKIITDFDIDTAVYSYDLIVERAEPNKRGIHEMTYEDHKFKFQKYAGLWTEIY